jgi:hypothetical protein
MGSTQLAVRVITSSAGFARAILRGRQGGVRRQARDDRRKGDEVPLRVKTKSPSGWKARGLLLYTS